MYDIMLFQSNLRHSGTAIFTFRPIMYTPLVSPTPTSCLFRTKSRSEAEAQELWMAFGYRAAPSADPPGVRRRKQMEVWEIEHGAVTLVMFCLDVCTKLPNNLPFLGINHTVLH